MQRLHSGCIRLRPAVPSAGLRGFTLIELMVVVAALSVVAAVAFAGFRQNEFRGSQKRWVADVQGALITARNFAIDQQTQVQVLVTWDAVDVLALDQATNVFSRIDRVALEGGSEELMATGQVVCNFGLQSGVVTPAMAANYGIAPPADCLQDQQELMFGPDGNFSDPNGTFLVTEDHAGATLYIGDKQEPTNVKLYMVQIFPGGLIRAFDKDEK